MDADGEGTAGKACRAVLRVPELSVRLLDLLQMTSSRSRLRQHPHRQLTTPSLTLRSSPERLQDNGGSILAISSSKFAVIAGDTRQSSGYNIETRTAKRVFQLTPEAAIAVQGFMGDAMNLVKRLKQRLEVSWVLWASDGRAASLETSRLAGPLPRSLPVN